MSGSEFCSVPYWWLFPLVMIILCFLAMSGRRGSMMCGFGSRGTANHKISESNSAIEILDKRYALGELNRKEYEERKGVLRQVPEAE
jgi:uncharacterized membrane protein